MEMKTRVSYLSPVRLAKENGFTVTDGGCRAGLTDGGFFNFQDASIVPEADRHALMKYYYGINLDKLIDLEIQ